VNVNSVLLRIPTTSAHRGEISFDDAMHRKPKNATEARQMLLVVENAARKAYAKLPTAELYSLLDEMGDSTQRRLIIEQILLRKTLRDRLFDAC
jgi:hypothetical protein